MTTLSTAETMVGIESCNSPEIKSLLLKSLWQKEVVLKELTLIAFVITFVQMPSFATMQKNQTLKLSLEDSEAFVDALLNPPLPNKALLAAAVRYQQTMSA